VDGRTDKQTDTGGAVIKPANPGSPGKMVIETERERQWTVDEY